MRASEALSQAGPSAREAAETLDIILSNASKGDEKYKRVRVSNKKFVRTAGKFAAALRLLEAVGFERQTDGGDDVLVLTRADPGLLWLGRSALADLKSGTTA